MPTIDTSAQLAAMIRAQFGAQYRARGGKRSTASTSPNATVGRGASRTAPDGGDASPAEIGDAALRQMVALRVSALAPDDPQRQRKAFRVFLESVLLQAFGTKRLAGSHLDQLVEVVLERMDGEPELHAALREAGELLLADIGV
jgi:hypothetical protein